MAGAVLHPDIVSAVNKHIPNTFTSIVQLAAALVPQRKTVLRHQLRSAYSYFPMPLTLGWETDPAEQEYPAERLVPELVLTDIASGATRPVVAPWIHELYSHTSGQHPSGVTLIHLKEAHFAKEAGWQHDVVLLVMFIQLSLGLTALRSRHGREGILVLVGLILQILEGVYAWAYPKYLPPRPVKNARFYALHTGMTTRHLLIVSHEPGTRGRAINLEDAAFPLRRRSTEVKRAILESLCRGCLRWSIWVFKASCAFASSRGFYIPSTFLIGTVTMELLSHFTTRLPQHDDRTELATADNPPLGSETTARDSNQLPTAENNAPSRTKPNNFTLLDMVLAACQMTGCVSIRFVEEILPDPSGRHVDYTWISDVMAKGVESVGPHPNHQISQAVYTSALSRRTVQHRNN